MFTTCLEHVMKCLDHVSEWSEHVQNMTEFDCNMFGHLVQHLDMPSTVQISMELSGKIQNISGIFLGLSGHKKMSMFV